MNYVAQRGLHPAPTPGLRDVDQRLLSLVIQHSGDLDFWTSKHRDRTDSAHCIFQYPAMMVPLVQRRLLGAVLEAQPEVQTLYDPFVGSGTSLVSGMHYGLGVFGNDVNPLAVLISRVRTERAVEFTIGAMCDQVARRAELDRRVTIETSLSNRDKWFKNEVAIELSKLRRAIRRCEDLWARRFMWVALAETVRLTSNDRTSTYKLHVRPLEEVEKRKLSPIAVFRELGKESAASFSAFRRRLKEIGTLSSGRYQAATDIRLADTCGDLKAQWTPQEPFDLMMTSPPYGDNLTTVTYGQHSYLPLNWIDFADIDPAADQGAIRTTQEIDRRSLGGRAGHETEAEEQLFIASSALKTFAETLPPKPDDGRARLVRFYADFSKSLESMVGLVRENGYMIWTVGNRNISTKQVPTDAILAELLEGANCKVVTTLTRRIHHKRMPHRNASSATMREEKILLVRKLRV
jgi:hypothetical protein